MNFTHLNRVFSGNLTCSQRMILVVMLNAMGRKNYCYVSHETMARMSGLCEKAVRLNVVELEKGGIVAKLGKRGKCNVYSVTFNEVQEQEWVPDFDDDPGNDYRGEDGMTPVTDSMTPVTDSQNPGNGYRQTTNEPPINHITRATSKKSSGVGRKKSSEADPRFVPFRNAWMEAYREAHGSDYHFHRHDGVQLAGFLKRDKTMTVAEWDGFLTWLNKSMIDNGQFTNGLIKLAAGSLASACSKFNQLLVLSLHETKRTNR
jgi:hypothetical protein